MKFTLYFDYDRTQIAFGLENVSSENANLQMTISKKPLGSLVVGEMTSATDNQHDKYWIERTL